MTIKNFLKALKSAVGNFKKDHEIDNSGFYYKGVNKNDAFGSPGGSWNSTDFPAFEFTDNNEVYLVRLVAEQNKIVIESSTQQLMILNYGLNDRNFLNLNSDIIEIKENYKMTVRHSVQSDRVKTALSAVGMSTDSIYKGNPNEYEKIIVSLISWAGKRAEAKKLIRAEQNGIKRKIDIPKDSISMPKQETLNRILFGPPGTGKTYSTIDTALELLGENIQDSREQKKRSFASYQKQGRIFFNTFHQNMAYEDFIEGIKPMEPQEEDEFLKYEIQDGLFMKACIEASYSYLVSRSRISRTEIQSFLDYNSLFDILFEEVSEAGSKSLSTRSQGTVTATITTQGNFAIRHEGKEKPYSVSRERLSVLYEKFPNLNEISNITNEFRNAIGGCNSTAYWSVLNELVELKAKTKRNKNNPEEILDPNLGFEQKKSIVKKYWTLRDTQPITEAKLEPFVFIIDEINRGNVSQIFGELITLIEDDKRIGKPEVLYIDLPYSKQPFAVPPNLYILGTMNTADRSVEALDIALRRRFVFEPKMPEPDILKMTDDGIDLPLMLAKLNNRLRILKDSDHTIGHAWLWGVKNVGELRGVFGNKILPLLQEYFYNDYEKLGLVLGDSFFQLPHKRVEGNAFAHFSGGSGLAGQYTSKICYQLKPADELNGKDFSSIYKSDIENEVE